MSRPVAECRYECYTGHQCDACDTNDYVIELETKLEAAKKYIKSLEVEAQILRDEKYFSTHSLEVWIPRAEAAEQKLCDIRAYAYNSERVTWRMQRIKEKLEDK